MISYFRCWTRIELQSRNKIHETVGVAEGAAGESAGAEGARDDTELPLIFLYLSLKWERRSEMYWQFYRSSISQINEQA